MFLICQIQCITGNFDTVASSGEDDHLASHSGGDARLTNLETGLSSLQASLVNISSLLTSQDKKDLTIPGYAFRLGRGAIFRDSTSKVSTACDPGCATI